MIPPKDLATPMRRFVWPLVGTLGAGWSIFWWRTIWPAPATLCG